jgi:hypothetical protein
MTQHSEHGGFIRSPIVAAENEPADTSFFRNVVINNAIHAYDSMTMVRVHDIVREPAGGSSWGPAGDSTTWGHAKMWGPFPLRLRADGTTCPLVVRLAARKSSGANTDYALQLMPYPSPFRTAPTPDADDESVATATATLTTYDWLTMSRSYLVLPRNAARPQPFVTPTVDGGVPTSVHVVLATLHLWSKSQDSNAVARGVYAREYIG